MSVIDVRRDDLFMLLADSPEGITITHIQQTMNLTLTQAKQAIQALRLFLGEDDEINVPCDPPEGSNGEWLYRLVGDLDSVRPWMLNRVNDSETRLRTMTAMMASIVKATHGNSIEGKKARLMETSLRHLVEDLDNMLSLEVA